MPAVDVAILSLGTSMGLRRADAALAELITAAGASARVVPVRTGRASILFRQITVTDTVQALAARHALRATSGARALIVSGATTALLLPRPQVPWAIRFDSFALLNRPGPSGAWQRARERAVLRRADALLPWGAAAAEAVSPLVGDARDAPAVIPLPVPVETRAAREPGGDVLAYTANPHKRGLDMLCAAWGELASPGVRLVIGGCDRDRGVDWLARRGLREPAGVVWAGDVERAQWLERVAGARLFVNASRREDHGLAQLEALASGTPLVTVPSPGPYEALPIARRLAPELVASDVSTAALAAAWRAGLALSAAERGDYATRARAELRPYEWEPLLEVVRERVLPALGIG